MAISRHDGLCEGCRWAAVVRSGRGSSFLRCGLSDGDARLPRYPPLPVRSCEGFEPRASATEPGGAEDDP